MGVEDVRAVPRRGHPRRHDRARRRQAEGAPGDVLAHFVPLPARDVARGAHALQWGVPARADVFEVIVRRHVLAMALGRLLQVSVMCQRGLAVAFAFLVYEAFDGGADLFEVARAGGRVGVGARARVSPRDGHGRRGAQEDRRGQGHACQGGQREAEASHGFPIGSLAVYMSPWGRSGRFVAATAPAARRACAPGSRA